MEALSERERGYLERLSWTQRVATAVGLVLSLVGAGYVAWAVYMFDWRVDPRTQVSFDGPIAQLGFLYDRYQTILDKVVPETQVEHWLVDGIKRGMIFSAGTMVMMLRIYIGTLVGLMGLVTLTIVVERRRLLRLIEKLQASESGLGSPSLRP